MSRLQLNSEDLLLVDDLVLGWVWFFRYNYLSNFKSDFYAVKKVIRGGVKIEQAQNCQNPNHNLNTTSTVVGFDMIMTVHHHHHHPPPTQELYLSYTQQTVQCNLTQSLTILLDYLRQLSYTILDNYPTLS